MGSVSIQSSRRLAHVVGIKLLFGFISEVGAVTQISFLEIQTGATRKLFGIAQRRRQSSRQPARQRALERLH